MDIAGLYKSIKKGIAHLNKSIKSIAHRSKSANEVNKNRSDLNRSFKELNIRKIIIIILV